MGEKGRGRHRRKREGMTKEKEGGDLMRDKEGGGHGEKREGETHKKEGGEDMG